MRKRLVPLVSGCCMHCPPRRAQRGYAHFFPYSRRFNVRLDGPAVSRRSIGGPPAAIPSCRHRAPDPIRVTLCEPDPRRTFAQSQIKSFIQSYRQTLRCGPAHPSGHATGQSVRPRHPL